MVEVWKIFSVVGSEKLYVRSIRCENTKSGENIVLLWDTAYVSLEAVKNIAYFCHYLILTGHTVVFVISKELFNAIKSITEDYFDKNNILEFPPIFSDIKSAKESF